MISVNPENHVIYVPQADLTFLGGTLYQLNMNTFRSWLNDWGDSEEGIIQTKTNDHNTEVPLSGIVYARIVSILDPYTVEFEDGQYTVSCTGANHNLAEVKVANQVSLIINNAAGLITNDAIEYSSYGGGVTVDTTSSNTGITFPVGTPQQPVNNFADGLSIAANRGFGVFYVVGDATIDNNNNFDAMVFVGESQTKSLVTVDSDASVIGCEFYDATVAGVLDGDCKLKNCTIGTLNYVNGVIEQCLLETGVITLAGGAEAHFLDCWSGVAGPDTPIIDMGGSGQDLSLRNYTGGITLQNKTGADNISIDLNSGQIKLKDTVTDGNIVCRGIGKLIEFTSGNFITTGDHNGATILNELISSHSITATTWNAVHIDTDGSIVDTDFPKGTVKYPVNNLTDAKIIADREGIDQFHLHGALILTGDYSNYSFTGDSHGTASITCSNTIVDNTVFNSCALSGYAQTGEIICTDVVFPTGFTHLHGGFENCQFNGNFYITPNGYIKSDRGTSRVSTTIVMSGSAVNTSMANSSGVFTITDCIDPTSTIGFTGTYLLNLASSCTDGSALIAGIGILNDSSTGTAVTNRTIPGAIWDELMVSHITPFTTGGELYSGSGGGGLTAPQTAAAVWDADPDSYKTSGTFGEWFRKLFWGGKKNT